jgi:hemerythrin
MARMRPLLGKGYILGHAAIDLDHRDIAECWEGAADCEPIELPFFLARLKRSMRRHFDREAALMLQAGGHLCECHQREHRTLLGLCDQAMAVTDRNWRRARSLLRNDLAKLVRAHVVSMDQIAVLFIRAHEERISTS